MAAGRRREAAATNSQMMSSNLFQDSDLFSGDKRGACCTEVPPAKGGLTFWLYPQALSKVAMKCSPRSKIQDSGGGYSPNDKFMWFARKPTSSKAAFHSDFDR